MTEEEMLGGICRGGRARDIAVKALIDAWGSKMLAFFVRASSGKLDPEDAEDILQDSIVKIVASAGTHKGQGSARSWLWQVARNTYLDYWRNRASAKFVPFDEELADSEFDTLASEETGQDRTAEECLANALNRFSERMPERAMALGLFLDGFSMADIGDRIGRTSTATKTYLCECRKKLAPFVSHCRELITV